MFVNPILALGLCPKMFLKRDKSVVDTPSKSRDQTLNESLCSYKQHQNKFNLSEEEDDSTLIDRSLRSSF